MHMEGVYKKGTYYGTPVVVFNPSGPRLTTVYLTLDEDNWYWRRSGTPPEFEWKSLNLLTINIL